MVGLSEDKRSILNGEDKEIIDMILASVGLEHIGERLEKDFFHEEPEECGWEEEICLIQTKNIEK